MKPGEGLAQILSKDKKLGEGKSERCIDNGDLELHIKKKN
jgi:hypothetical protein